MADEGVVCLQVGYGNESVKIANASRTKSIVTDILVGEENHTGRGR